MQEFRPSGWIVQKMFSLAAMAIQAKHKKYAHFTQYGEYPMRAPKNFNRLDQLTARAEGSEILQSLPRPGAMDA
jgi:hypothetical protein